MKYVIEALLICILVVGVVALAAQVFQTPPTASPYCVRTICYDDEGGCQMTVDGPGRGMKDDVEYISIEEWSDGSYRFGSKRDYQNIIHALVQASYKAGR